jgi:glycosyltransferase involved in cell wall biosynthesis
MSWDKPQIVSDNPFAHDSCGNAAIYVSDSDVDAWTRAMIALRCDEKERERLVINGRKQIELFPKSWRDMAKQVHAILEKVVVSRKC